MNPQEQPVAPQPVAYDVEGRPLYYHPPTPSASQQTSPESPTRRQSHITMRPEQIEGHNFNPQIRTQYANEPDAFHTTRPLEVKKFEISDDLKRRHELSKERYPYLNLSEAEFVILDIKRHPIGMLTSITVTFAMLVAILAFGSLYPSMYESAAGPFMLAPSAMFMAIVFVAAMVVLGGAAMLWVYLQNQFFMTNESVIQEIQETLFARREQTVSLGSIEDASFKQTSILQTIFDYGTIRLSTEGQETTYTFRYVTNPKKQIAILNNAIESFKNGRPVDPHDN